MPRGIYGLLVLQRMESRRNILKQLSDSLRDDPLPHMACSASALQQFLRELLQCSKNATLPFVHGDKWEIIIIAYAIIIIIYFFRLKQAEKFKKVPENVLRTPQRQTHRSHSGREVMIWHKSVKTFARNPISQMDYSKEDWARAIRRQRQPSGQTNVLKQGPKTGLYLKKVKAEGTCQGNMNSGGLARAAMYWVPGTAHPETEKILKVTVKKNYSKQLILFNFSQIHITNVFAQISSVCTELKEKS